MNKHEEIHLPNGYILNMSGQQWYRYEPFDKGHIISEQPNPCELLLGDIILSQRVKIERLIALLRRQVAIYEGEIEVFEMEKE